jgi:hypothetical protein
MAVLSGLGALANGRVGGGSRAFAVSATDGALVASVRTARPASAAFVRRAACVVLTGVVVLGALAPGARAENPSPLLPRPGLQALQVEVPPAATTTPIAAPKKHVPVYQAALMSALLPGLGEAYTGHTTRALLSGGAEAAIWISYATFKVQEDNREDRSREFANYYAGALTNGDEDYYKAVGQFVRAEGPGMWNEFVRRQARDTGEIVGREYTGSEAWAWTSDQRFIDYRELRRDQLTAEDHAQAALACAIVNRVISVVSVSQAVRSDHKREQELGLRLDPGQSPLQYARLGLWNRF